ncbi:MAG TPA: class I SAM-dependent methyltransferase [Candidatus Saccharimonadales bacterium]|nr:class I SAM-dependent methyltransferase [Candidatus Saccharimonadales bacterium]
MTVKNFIDQNKDIFYFKTLERHLQGCKSVLDIGCGDDSPLRRVKKTFSSHGVDAFAPSIKKSKAKKIHDTYTTSDLLKIDKLFKPNSFDAVIALDVIEHFDKKTAKVLIKKMEKIARKKIILLTPNGFYPQDAYGNNPWQVHKCGWSKKEFEDLGYKVYGLRGPKFLRGDYATILYKPWIFWGLVAFITEPFLHFTPSLSYDLFGVKRK